MEFSHSENEVTISVKKRFHDKLEDTNLIIDNKGIIFSGTRKTTYRNSRKSRLESLRKEGTKIYIKSIYNSRTKTDEIELPEELPCAVDVSLLYLFRISIMHLADGLKVFMVDFSGRSTKVLVKNTGTDKIIVPAGEYTCYRIDVKIRFLIFFTKITYWITKDEPHFLVKHEGKLGPFTRRYVTELVKIKNKEIKGHQQK